MEKLDVLITLGKLEALLNGNDRCIQKVKELEQAIATGKTSEAAVSFGMVQAFAPRDASNEIQENFNAVYNYLTEKEPKYFGTQEPTSFAELKDILNRLGIDPSKLPSPYNILFLPIQTLGFSTRASNVLYRCFSLDGEVGEMVEQPLSYYTRLRCCGPKTVTEIKDKIHVIGLDFLYDFKKAIQLEILELSPRSFTLLKARNINTILELSFLTQTELLDICGMHEKCATEIIQKLQELGIELMDE